MDEKYVEIMANLLIATRLTDQKEIESDFEDVINNFSQTQLLDGYAQMQNYANLLKRIDIREGFYASLLQHMISLFENLLKNNLSYPTNFLTNELNLFL